MSAAANPPAEMTVAEFITWSAAQPGNRWQLVDGTPRGEAPASPRHGAIQSEVARLIGNHLVAVDRPSCRVVIEPGVQPSVNANRNLRVPDLGITCAPWDEDRKLSAPLVLVEILSPSNHADTWTAVRSYTTIPSVREILVLHTSRICVDLLRRQADGSWPNGPQRLLAGDDVHLESIGFTVPVADFYRTSGLA